MPVRSVTIRSIEGDETGVKIVDQSTSEDGAMYSFQWHTNDCNPDKKRKRSKVYGYFSIKIFFKFFFIKVIHLPLWLCNKCQC